MINGFTKVFKEKRGVTSVLTYKFVGHGYNAQPIYSEFESKFSVARGVFQRDKFTRYVDENEITYNSFVR